MPAFSLKKFLSFYQPSRRIVEIHVCQKSGFFSDATFQWFFNEALLLAMFSKRHRICWTVRACNFEAKIVNGQSSIAGNGERLLAVAMFDI